MELVRSETFEQFLQESFAGGITTRELRLSREQLAIVKNAYPKAKITLAQPNETQEDGKAWYEINLSPLNDNRVTGTVFHFVS